MKTLKFKTNINCGGCLAKVAPFLDKLEGISTWKVDTNSKDKILQVETDALSAESIEEAVKKAGFSIEPVKKNFLGSLLGRS